jgi:hypothetical protein
MGLTDDQRAMLRLLAERGEEGYEDIAALKGVSVDRVRAEMREALAAAAAEQEPPVESAAPKEAAPPPAVPKPVESAPAPPPPTTPPAKPAPAPGAPKRRRSAAPPPARRRFVLAAAGALAVLALVLGLIAVIGGTSGDSGSGAAANSGTEAAAGKLTQAELLPVSGQSGEGRAIFGRVGKEEIVLQVAAEGLEPSRAGQSYTVWLYRSPKIALRIGSAKVSKSGRLGVQLPIPAELLAYVVSGAFDHIYLSRTSDAAYAREVVQAKKQKKLPAYSGETVLSGEITGPIVKKTSGESH